MSVIRFGQVFGVQVLSGVRVGLQLFPFLLYVIQSRASPGNILGGCQPFRGVVGGGGVVRVMEYTPTQMGGRGVAKLSLEHFE